MVKRVDKGRAYWYITSDSTGRKWKSEEAYEFDHEVDQARFHLGNYFPSFDEAETFRKKITEDFMERTVIKQPKLQLIPDTDRVLVDDKFFEKEDE